MVKKTLIYISNNALQPNGELNTFFKQEYELCLSSFKKAYLLCPAGAYEMLEGYKLKPLISSGIRHWMSGVVDAVFCADIYNEVFHAILHSSQKLRNVLRIIQFTIQGQHLYMILQTLINELALNVEQVQMYSYWLSYDSYAAAKTKARFPVIGAFARAHAYDIQRARNSCNPYLMKKYILGKLDAVYCISKQAKEEVFSYITDEFLRQKIHVCYLGTRSDCTGVVANRKLSGEIKLISCSSMLPVKQIHILIDVLAEWTVCPIVWWHIGDGPLRAELEQYAEKRLNNSQNVSYDFLYAMDNSMVRKTLQEYSVNFFVNTSKSEGTPVSIMEAMSFGIPIIAPRVNGIPEMYNEDAGYFLDPNNMRMDLANVLMNISMLSQREYAKMCLCSYESWKRRFVLEMNFHKVVEN